MRRTAGRTTTAGPRVWNVSATTSPTVSRLARWAVTPKLSARATKSGRASSVAVAWPNASGHVLPQDPVAAVVDDQPRHVGVVLAGGGEFGDGVHRAAVPGDGESALAGPDRRGERSRDRRTRDRPRPVPNGTALQADPTPTTPSTPRWSCPRTCVSTAGPRREGRSSASARSSTSCVASRASTASRSSAAIRAPAVLGRGVNLFGDGLQRQRRVGVDGEAGVVRLEHAGFRVDVDEPASRREGEVVARHLAHRGPDGQQDVGVLQELRGVAVLDPRRRGQRMVEGDRALAADGRDHRRVKQFRERGKSLGPARRAAYATAGQDDRTLSPNSTARPPRRRVRRGAVDPRRAVTTDVTGGTSVGSSNTSCGISTHVGPAGADCASAHASARRLGISAACRTTAVLLVTLTALRCWSSSWCSMPRRSPSPARGTWLVMTSSGTPVAYASCKAPSAVSAPGPVDRNSTPTSPVALVYPSAPNAELFSTAN